ncbi:MAG TPA: hypothetical protein VFB58_14590 [Chloroflexota bacterium]|nr:hypothetical protein [Chloroflexota bacterium]
MHKAPGALRSILLAFVLVMLALPAATITGTSGVHAQTPPSPGPGNIAGVGYVSPAIAFNTLGSNHTVTFVCTNATGCSGVVLTAANASLGTSTPFTQGTCAGAPVTPTGSTVACPAGTVLTPSGGVVPAPAASTATGTINEGAPYVYTITVTGTVPTGTGGAAAGACPTGTTLTAVGAATCSFSITAQKKYVEITKIVATSTPSTCGGTVIFSEALKSYFGPSCTVVFTASGTVTIKTVSTCAGEPSGPAPAEYGPGAMYVCNNGTLGVTGVTGPVAVAPTFASAATACATGTLTIAGAVATCVGPSTAPGTGTFAVPFTGTCPDYTTLTMGTDALGNQTATCVPNSNLSSIPLTLTSSGFGLSGGTIGTGVGTFCAGVGTVTGTTVTTGTPVTLCPTTFGTASVFACTGAGLNTQPAGICSNTITANYTVQAESRVVPYVKWAGEKQVLTKCFGVGAAGGLIEFTLQGNNPGLNATLLPVDTSQAALAAGVISAPTSDTVYAVPDALGCASVILYAAGEGAAYVDAALYAPPAGAVPGTVTPIINEHAFEVFYLKFDHVSLENIAAPGSSNAGAAPSFSAASTIGADITFLATAAGSGTLAGIGAGQTFPVGTTASSITYVTAPGAGQAAGGTYAIPLCGTDLLRAMVHGYFEIPGDPSSRAAATVSIPNAPAGSAGGYTLPAGRWVLPEDWPVLATFAGFTATPGQTAPGVVTPSSVYSWDINSGFAFNPQVEPAVLCTGPNMDGGNAPVLVENGPIADFNTGPCYGGDELGIATGTVGAGYSTAPDGLCAGGETVAIGPFDATQACTNPYPLPYSPSGSGAIVPNGAPSPVTGATYTCGTATTCEVPLGPNSTYLPNGFLSQWDAPMPPAQVTFAVTGGPGTLQQINKTALYSVPAVFATPGSYCTVNAAGACVGNYYYNPFYAEAIPSSPLIPPVTNDGGYLWDSWGFSFGHTTVTTAAATPLTTTIAAATTVCSVAGTPDTVTVASGAGFSAGDVITLTSAATGAVVTGTVNSSTATTITFTCAPGTAATALAVGDVVSDATQVSLPVATSLGAAIGEPVTLTSPTGVTCTTFVTGVTATSIVVALTGATCAAANFPAGTTVSFGTAGACGGSAAGLGSACTGPGGEILAAPRNPYPFWQWVPGASTGAAVTSATVYSDNHGEAIVGLTTGFNQQVLPTNGVCPTGYTPVPTAAAPTNCIAPLAALGAAGFGNVAAALKAGAGCYNTDNTGAFSAAAGATVGPNGPAAGQICVNSLGNIELGTGAALGSTTVQAIADYPYTRGEHPQISSGSITKVFTSMFAKSVSVSTGTAGPAGTTSYTVTITATDVCGNALVGEPIYVYALGPSGGVVLSPTGASDIANSSSSATVFVNPATGTSVLSLEVLGTAIGTSGLVIKVVFPAEGIERFATVIPGSTTPSTVTVNYNSGYQMIGGPSNSNFGVAEAVFSYSPTTNAYSNVTASDAALSSAPPACTGYWAYFAAPASVSLPATSKPGDTATCTLAAGWNLVGNPFASPATLPAGTVAYHWNGTSYDTVGSIPVGGAVWVYMTAAGSLTLTAS